MPALDYDPRVASLYDDYCTFTDDIAYFTDLAGAADGPVLELMAGTGRVSIPMAIAGAAVRCVDLSTAMLGVLARKRTRLGLGILLTCADVRALPFREARFSRVVLPFHGLSELVVRSDRVALFAAVHRVTRCGGSFVCTLHNPAVRLRSLEGAWRVLGEVRRGSGGTVRLSLRAAWDAASGLVVGEQRLEAFRPDSGRLEMDLLLPLRFALPPLAEVLEDTERLGFRATAVYGDYARSPYVPDTSPFVIIELEKLA